MASASSGARRGDDGVALDRRLAGHRADAEHAVRRG